MFLGQGVVEVGERGVRRQVASLDGSLPGHVRLGALLVQQPAGALVMHRLQAEGHQVSVRSHAPLADEEVEQARRLGGARQVGHRRRHVARLDRLREHSIRRGRYVLGRAPHLGWRQILHRAFRQAIGQRLRFRRDPHGRDVGIELKRDRALCRRRRLRIRHRRKPVHRRRLGGNRGLRLGRQSLGAVQVRPELRGRRLPKLIARHAAGSTAGSGRAKNERPDQSPGLCVVPHAFGQRLVGVDFFLVDEVLNKPAERIGACELQRGLPVLGYRLDKLVAEAGWDSAYHAGKRDEIKQGLRAGVLRRHLGRLLRGRALFNGFLVSRLVGLGIND